MNNEEVDLSIQRSLELLQELKQTTADFAQREAHLTRDLSTRRNAATRTIREGKERIEDNYSLQLARVNAACDSEASRLTEYYEARIARFLKLSETALRSLPEQAEAAKKRWMGDLQMQHFFAGRKKTEGLKAAEKAHTRITGKLARLRMEIVQIQARTAKAFSGYPSFTRLLQASLTRETLEEADSMDAACERLRGQIGAAEDQLAGFNRFPLPKLFSYIPLPAWPMIIVAIATLAGLAAGNMIIAGIAAVGLLGGVFLVHRTGHAQSKASATILAGLSVQAGHFHKSCCAAADRRFAEENQRLHAEHDATCAAIQAEWDRADQVEAEFEKQARKKADIQIPRMAAKLENVLAPKLEAIEAERDARLSQIHSEAEAAREIHAEATHSGLAEVAAH